MFGKFITGEMHKNLIWVYFGRVGFCIDLIDVAVFAGMGILAFAMQGPIWGLFGMALKALTAFCAVTALVEGMTF